MIEIIQEIKVRINRDLKTLNDLLELPEHNDREFKLSVILNKNTPEISILGFE